MISLPQVAEEEQLRLSVIHGCYVSESASHRAKKCMRSSKRSNISDVPFNSGGACYA